LLRVGRRRRLEVFTTQDRDLGVPVHIGLLYDKEGRKVIETCKVYRDLDGSIKQIGNPEVCFHIIKLIPELGGLKTEAEKEE